jgi:Tol biopolymer transport system component
VEPPYGLAWAPDGSKTAFYVSPKDTPEDRVEVYVIDAATGDLRRIARENGYAADLAWHPDGG